MSGGRANVARHVHSAHGVTLWSPFALPELPRSDDPADAVLGLGAVGRDDLTPRRLGAWRSRGDEIAVVYDGLLALSVRGGREIVVDPSKGTTLDIVRAFVVGAALGLLLHQRGYLVLHASSVLVDGRVGAFLGRSGSGKSTLASALAARGHRVISDDLAPIGVDGAQPTLIGGGLRLRLWPDTAELLGEDAGALTVLAQGTEKRAWRLPEAPPRGPLPVRRIYALHDDAETALEPLRPGPACAELIRHSYCARVLDPLAAKVHFRQCATLAGSAEVVRLGRPRLLDSLPQLAELVERDLRQRP